MPGNRSPSPLSPRVSWHTIMAFIRHKDIRQTLALGGGLAKPGGEEQLHLDSHT